ncbi:MAG: DGQHR domain-containing protein, partial [Candidatus Heimdallarchaeaceae archaeon]
MSKFESAKKIQQGNNSFYLVVMTVKQLMKHAKIDYYDPKTNEGYQRKPSSSRVKEARAYITKKRDSSFPLTIVANVRSLNSIKYDEDAGTLEIPDDETIYIIDGQHRYEALRTAIQDEGFDRLEDFEVAVSLFNFNDPLREALEFLVINRSAKSVRTDLAERIITLAFEDKSKREQLRYEAAGPMKKILKDAEHIHALTTIVDALNLDENSFWFEKIQLPNAPKGSTTVTQRTFTQSLKKFSKTPAFEELSNEDIIKALNNYWDVIEEFCEYTTSPESDSV